MVCGAISEWGALGLGWTDVRAWVSIFMLYLLYLLYSLSIFMLYLAGWAKVDHSEEACRDFSHSKVYNMTFPNSPKKMWERSRLHSHHLRCQRVRKKWKKERKSSLRKFSPSHATCLPSRLLQSHSPSASRSRWWWIWRRQSLKSFLKAVLHVWQLGNLHWCSKCLMKFIWSCNIWWSQPLIIN